MKALLMVVAAISILSGCSPTLSSMQRRSIEARELKGSFDDAYKATLQVLQDHSYTIKSTDYQSGVIHGETAVRFVWFVGMTNYEI